MKKIFSESDEFYVGYLPEVPKATSAFFRKVILSTLGFLLIAGYTLVISQRDFTTSEFEYGRNTSLSGIFAKTPIPRIRISLGKNYKGKELYQSVVLVGSGKHSAEGQLKNIPTGAFVTITGFLIYGDGKALLQINDDSNISVKETNTTNLTSGSKADNIGNPISVTGEITDPKCFFGVMKPGEGKAHRSCAIRCISGGIPPVLKINSSDYFLLLDENMETINSEVLPIVGDQVSFHGEVVELDDWRILKIKRNEIIGLTGTAQQRKVLLALEEGMTFCSQNKSNDNKCGNGDY